MSSSHAQDSPVGDEDETDPDETEDVITHSEAQGTPRRRARSPLGLPREARVGLAVSLSFALLVGVMVFNKSSKGKTPPLATLSNSTGSKDSGTSKDDGGTVADAKGKTPPDSNKAEGEKRGATESSPAEGTGQVASDTHKPSSESVQPAPVDGGLRATADQTQGNGASVATAPTPNDNAPEGASFAPATASQTDTTTAPPVPVTAEPASNTGDASNAGSVQAPVTAETPREEPSSNPAPLPAPVAGLGSSEGGATGATRANTEIAPSPGISPAPADTAPSTLPPVEPIGQAQSPSAVVTRPEPSATEPASGALQPANAAGLSPNVDPPPAASAPTSSRVVAPKTLGAASSSAVIPMSGEAALSGGQGDWVKLPNSRFQRGADDQAATRTARADKGDNAPAEPVAPEVADKIEPIPHVVQRGENFWTISRLYYRSGRYWKALWAANRDKVKEPKALVRGTTIRIPPHEELDPSLIEPAGAPTVERPKVAAVPLRRTSRPVLNGELKEQMPFKRIDAEDKLALPAAESFDEPVSTRTRSRREPVDNGSDEEDETERSRRPRYKVRSRYETLRSIAKATLGDAHREDEILELNRKVIKDPYHLTPGQQLELPEDALVSGNTR